MIQSLRWPAQFSIHDSFECQPLCLQWIPVQIAEAPLIESSVISVPRCCCTPLRHSSHLVLWQCLVVAVLLWWWLLLLLSLWMRRRHCFDAAKKTLLKNTCFLCWWVWTVLPCSAREHSDGSFGCQSSRARLTHLKRELWIPVDKCLKLSISNFYMSIINDSFAIVSR